MEFDNKINVASSELGTRVISTSDEFFAAADRMLMPSEPVFMMASLMTMENGWMDGKPEEEDTVRTTTAS